jgi:hypothetical protein
VLPPQPEQLNSILHPKEYRKAASINIASSEYDLAMCPACLTIVVISVTDSKLIVGRSARAMLTLNMMLRSKVRKMERIMLIILGYILQDSRGKQIDNCLQNDVLRDTLLIVIQ